MSVNVPFTNSILDISSGNNSIVYVPAFPGAYFYNAYPANANGWFIPIYTSISNFSHNGFLPLFNDVDKQVTVLPGYTLEMYSDISYTPIAYTIDNSAGTDIKISVIPTINTGSSCKLYYTPASTGIKSELTYMPNPVLISNGNYSYVSYGGNDYVLFSYTSGTGAIMNNTLRDLNAQVLVVAGGGAGGSSLNLQESAGGGGGGGVMVGTMTFIKKISYTCTAGNGGQSSNTNGGDSTITNTSNSQNVNAKGGGGGASCLNYASAGSGGSCGGNCSGYSKGSVSFSATKQNGTSTITGGSFTPYGNGGGYSWGTSGAQLGGGGGGGAGGTGDPAWGTNTGIGGYGGYGYTWPVNNVTYAGGGGGGSGMNTSSGSPGRNGGGRGGSHLGSVYPTDGTNGLGGGGGGGQSYVNTFGRGGSGIIIIAIKMSDIY